MGDRLSPQERSRVMSRIRSRDTGPELAVRSFLHRQGFRFRLHRKDLPGKPDIVLPKYRAVIFVHGCFWHQHPGCREGRIPGSRRSYWAPKLRRNVERDREARAALARDGWRVCVVWECELEPETLAKLVQWIRFSPDPAGVPPRPVSGTSG